MNFKTPSFWYHTSLNGWQKCLLPLSYLYGRIVECRYSSIKPQKVDIPVICIGNLVVGGAGKTPTAVALADYLLRKGYEVHFLTRGYGGEQKGPLRVDLDSHKFYDVGDEALLLARVAPTWVARDRVAGARMAAKNGAQVLIMDDGFQNPSLFKDLSLVVVDRIQGYGNGHVFPAGPLREPLNSAYKRADAIIYMTNTNLTIPSCSSLNQYSESDKNVIVTGNIQPTDDSIDLVKNRSLMAFAGIGYPEKFFSLLKTYDGDVIKTCSFPDHHPYSIDDLQALMQEAHKKDAILVTTEKDIVRIPKELQSQIKIFKIHAYFEPFMFEKLLQPLLGNL